MSRPFASSTTSFPGATRYVVYGDQARHVSLVLRRVLRNQHSGMIGWVYVMEPAALRSLAQRPGGEGSMASARRKAVPTDMAAATCHIARHTGTLSQSAGPVRQSGANSPTAHRCTADEAYVRESISESETQRLSPASSRSCRRFKGRSTKKVLQLIAYIRSLSKPASRRDTRTSTDSQESLTK